MSQQLPFSERTERVILAIIVADLLLQGAETVPALAGAARLFHWAGIGTWLVFTVEWCLRIRRAENWKKYAFSFFGIMDFLAILPLWLLTGFDLKALRAFRLFRLVRATGKLAGRGTAVAKLVRAFNFAKDEAGALFFGHGSDHRYDRPRHVPPGTPRAAGGLQLCSGWLVVVRHHPDDGRGTATSTP